MVARELAELESLLRLHNLSSRVIRRHEGNDLFDQILLRLHYTSDGRLPQAELADALQFSISQIHKVTEAMQEQDGLIVREQGAPRGGVFIRLTDAGKKRVADFLSERAAEFHLIDQLLGKTDESPILEQLLNQLRAVVMRRSAPLRAAG